MTSESSADTAENSVALAQLFTDFGRELASQPSVDAVLTILSRRAYEVVPAAEHAAISRGRPGGSVETIAATDDLPPKVDQIQYQLSSGPCVDAVLDDSVYRVGDLVASKRWAEFGRRASSEYGIHSMLSVRIYLEDSDVLAGINLYSSARDAFDEADQVTATLLATHGALALTAANRQNKIDNLERALETSRTIGMAMGILMASHKVVADQAFDLLRIASQTQSRKLAESPPRWSRPGRWNYRLPLPRVTADPPFGPRCPSRIEPPHPRGTTRVKRQPVPHERRSTEHGWRHHHCCDHRGDRSCIGNYRSPVPVVPRHRGRSLAVRSPRSHQPPLICSAHAGAGSTNRRRRR